MFRQVYGNGTQYGIETSGRCLFGGNAGHFGGTSAPTRITSVWRQSLIQWSPEVLRDDGIQLRIPSAQVWTRALQRRTQHNIKRWSDIGCRFARGGRNQQTCGSACMFDHRLSAGRSLRPHATCQNLRGTATPRPEQPRPNVDRFPITFVRQLPQASGLEHQALNIAAI